MKTPINIISIENIENFWRFTLPTPPPCGWDVWYQGNRIATQFHEEEYVFPDLSESVPIIQVIDPAVGFNLEG